MAMNPTCEVCGDSLAEYLPGVRQCDNCTDKHGIESNPLNAALIDIAKGL